MDLVFSILKYIGLGLAAFIGLFIAVAVLFGKRIEKQWAFRADFMSSDGRDRTGKFEIDNRRVEGEGSDFRIRAGCKLRHPMLRSGQPVQVKAGDTVLMEGRVEQDGRVRLHDDARLENAETPQAGDTVAVWAGGEALVSARLYSEIDPAASTVEKDAPDAGIPRSAKVLRKSNAKPLGLAFIVFGLAGGYLAWRNDAAPFALGLIGLLPLTGVYLLRSKTTNILYIDNGRLGWYSRFNRELYHDQVAIEAINALKAKPYKLGYRHGGCEVVLALTDGYETPLPENLFDGNVMRYAEKHLLAELRKANPSIEYVEEEPVHGRPTNRIRPAAGSTHP